MKVFALNVNNFLKGLTQIYCWRYSKSERFGDFCQIQEKDYNKYIAYLQLYISNFIPREFIFVNGYTGHLKISKKTKFLWSQYQQSVTTTAFSASRSSGGSNCTIQSTSGISRPLAATSVQIITLQEYLLSNLFQLLSLIHLYVYKKQALFEINSDHFCHRRLKQKIKIRWL
ncbi:hypothetical protein ALC57_10063 [Trachymyrmex cornetzi]|uniref:Uncharacterized protein n=1 Tax=Trachymyrmex cornetzi TaxID=471704 RepID=A0A195DYL1_9HYME|nr:hypothetical protein ALC57_10063 [Trachymyrmex cornetzi]